MYNLTIGFQIYYGLKGCLPFSHIHSHFLKGNNTGILPFRTKLLWKVSNGHFMASLGRNDEVKVSKMKESLQLT